MHPDDARRSLAHYDPRHVLIAKDAAGTVIGLARGTLSEGNAWIDAPGARADYRGTTLQTALLTQLLERLQADGANAFTLEAWGEDPACIQAYQGLGFEPLEVTPLVAWHS